MLDSDCTLELLAELFADSQGDVLSESGGHDLDGNR